MTNIPIELPLKAEEAAAFGALVCEHLQARRLTDETRARLANRVAALKLTSLRPFLGSLQADPIHPQAFFVAVDGAARQCPEPLLLRIAPSSTPASGLFPQALLIGRVRPGHGPELVISASPFSSRDHARIRTFAEVVDRDFLPRPRGTRSAIAVGNRHPEISLPAAFDAYRAVLKSTGANFASTGQLDMHSEMATEAAISRRDGEDPAAPGHTRVSIRHLYHAGLWAAIRAGWREGCTMEADRIRVAGATPDQLRDSMDAARTAIQEAAGYTKFTADTSSLFELRADPRHAGAWGESAVREKFEALYSQDEQLWILEEFARPFRIGESVHQFTLEEIVRLAVKFGAALRVNEELFDSIRRAKASRTHGRTFDFEFSLHDAGTLTSPADLIFCLHWLKSRGRTAQLAAPDLGFRPREPYPEDTAALADLGARLSELAAVARHFHATLSIHAGGGKQAAVLEQVAKSTAGRVNYKICGELQLQLLEVLAAQPPGSHWRRLYERMVERCNHFAAHGAFGEAGDLAAWYLSLGCASYLGDPARHRADGNLFLRRWLGHVVGSTDVDSPDGDHRFFKEKLDELPEDLAREARSRHTAYIVWLAGYLRG